MSTTANNGDLLASAEGLDGLGPVLKSLVKYDPGTIKAHLEDVELDARISGSDAKAHCYFIALDGNQRPKTEALIRFLAHTIVDYAIPRTEIVEALRQVKETNSAFPMTRLRTKAEALFSSAGTTGEGGEILLYALAEHVLHFPQILTKMSLKTNPDMHFHGADGVHACANEDGGLDLYFGQSKLHKSFGSAIDECAADLQKYLTGEGKDEFRLGHELTLIRDNVIQQHGSILKPLKTFLDPDHPNYNKTRFCGLGLIGHDTKRYPTAPNQINANNLRKLFLEDFVSIKENLSSAITKNKIDSFIMHLFCIPFPNISDFRNALRGEIIGDNS